MAISTLSPTKGNHGPACVVCAALAALDPVDAAALRDHLANPAWRYTELSEALRGDPDTPLDLPSHALSRHSRGQCAARERLR